MSKAFKGEPTYRVWLERTTLQVVEVPCKDVRNLDDARELVLNGGGIVTSEPKLLRQHATVKDIKKINI